MICCGEPYPEKDDFIEKLLISLFSLLAYRRMPAKSSSKPG
jgi:hypothetical protein